jgi:hypothetical protein
MIAAFLRTEDGDFNYPAALCSGFFLFCIFGLVVGLARGIKTGRILVSWGSQFRGSGQFYVERANNPSDFWCWVGFYCLAMLLMAAMIVVISFGLLRKPA